MTVTYGTEEELIEILNRPVPGVSEEISPAERMDPSNKSYYLWVGQSAMRLIRLALLAAGRNDRSVRHVLDMACGHGRVLRVLRAHFPDAHLTACDVLRDGVDFCAATFGATPVYSNPAPTAALFPDAGKYDLIFVGSLFTHLSADRWPVFLNLLHELLAPEGVLVFTSHGPFVAYRMNEGTDYGYTKEQLALNRQHYAASQVPSDSQSPQSEPQTPSPEPKPPRYRAGVDLVRLRNQLYGLFHETLHTGRCTAGVMKRLSMRAVGMQPPPPKPLPTRSTPAKNVAPIAEKIETAPPPELPPIEDPTCKLPPDSPVRELLRDYRRTGFGYLDDGLGFGVSLSQPSWVLAQIEKIPELRVMHYGERAWGMHQDAIVVVKSRLTDPFAAAPNAS